MWLVFRRGLPTLETKKMKTPEGFVKSDVKKYLKGLQTFFFSNTTFGYGGSGQPDITCCIGGRFVGLEIKGPGKVPTTKQYQRMAEIRRAGGIAIWGDSAEGVIEQIKTALGLPD